MEKRDEIRVCKVDGGGSHPMGSEKSGGGMTPKRKFLVCGGGSHPTGRECVVVG